jgi:hypothetical protein
MRTVAAKATNKVRVTSNPYTIVHRSPGRVRLRLDGELPGVPHFAASIALHPATSEVRWVAAARSMTVTHDVTVAPETILRAAGRQRPPAVMLERREAPRIPGAAALKFLPGGGAASLALDIAAWLLAPPTAQIVRRV